MLQKIETFEFQELTSKERVKEKRMRYWERAIIIQVYSLSFICFKS